MAYLRRNYKHVELVKSVRINGLPRLKVLAREKTFEKLDKKIKAQAKSLKINYPVLSKKAAQLFKDITQPRSASSINTTTGASSSPLYPKTKVKNDEKSFEFNTSDYLRYKDEFILEQEQE